MLENEHLECWIINSRFLLGHVCVLSTLLKLFPCRGGREEPCRAELSGAERARGWIGNFPGNADAWRHLFLKNLPLLSPGSCWNNKLKLRAGCVTVPGLHKQPRSWENAPVPAARGFPQLKPGKPQIPVPARQPRGTFWGRF